MQYLDGIKPEPTTAYRLFKQWQANMVSDVLSGSMRAKKIDVLYIPKFDDKACPEGSNGRRYCEQQGEHTWFNHSMDHAL